ncbi:relaxase/mobilization nuclease domain-containing protein [uncultured Cellulomonas sp.]|uniref:relaxase/mobilization nuclease domain-containing protein n=1 Tax=uncultured Cellulomonas sp. TaxID=189682 RepID=UPI00263935CC|nr:relaxase/mobilization nuclease domain-containing protein [uncultured Cellulomonas sp.]
MISKVIKGSNMHSLVRYLTGPGRANEHTNPHLVGSSGTLAQEYAGTEWGPGKNGELSIILDGDWRRVRREQGLPLSSEKDEKVRGVARGEHVFHVSLSLDPTEGKLTDEAWATIAAEYVDAMDFAGPATAASGRAQCQWIAVHHGATRNGGDHVHLAVNLVRADGTRASVYNDYKRSRTVVDAIEARHGLRRVKDRAAENGLPGYSQAEAARAQRTGATERDTAALARRLRSAAAVSTSEAEYVRSVRLAGVLVRPRYAPQSTDQVRGYAVAMPPAPGERPVWRAPSKIDRVLGLGQLRARWGAAPDGSDAAGQDAVAVWRHATTATAPTGASKWTSMRAMPPEAAAQLSALTARLAKVDQVDRVAWQAAAREASFVFARWSLQTEGNRPGALARASESLARSAQPDKDQRGANPEPGLFARNAAMMARAASPNAAAGWFAVMRQLDRVTQAVQDAHTARGELVAGARLSTRTGMDLVTVRRELVAAGKAPGAHVDEHAADTVVAPAVQAPAQRGSSPGAEDDTAVDAAARAARQGFPDAPGVGPGRPSGTNPSAAPPGRTTGTPRRDRRREDHEL